MERQKLWICISIAFLLLLAVIAAVLIAAPNPEIHDSASFVERAQRDKACSCGGFKGTVLL